MSARAPGARSVWGSMSAYLKLALVVLPIMAVALVAALLAEPERPRLVLPAGGRWTSAVVELVPGRAVLAAGEELELPAGRYEVILMGADGLSERRGVTIGAGRTELDPR